MNRARTLRIRSIILGMAVLATGGLVSIFSTGFASESLAPAPQQSSTTTGTRRTLDNGNLGIRRFEFEAGSRYFWHTHNWAPQVLMMESGKGLVQVRGGPVIELLPNQPFIIPQGVEHWHGAGPDESGIQWNIYDGLGVSGSVTWGDPVTDAEYSATPVRLSVQSVQLPWQDAIQVVPPSASQEDR